MTRNLSDLFTINFAAWFSLGMMYYAVKAAVTQTQHQGFDTGLVVHAGFFGFGAICFYQFFIGSENLFKELCFGR